MARTPSPGPGADEGRAPRAPTTRAPNPSERVWPFGEALKARAADVLRETVERTIGSGEVVDEVVQESFERICSSSTMAVARWMAGEGLDVAYETGRETWELFGELAAHRAASLNEVTRRCLCWRDVMAEVLNEIAGESNASAEALSDALALLQQSLEFS